MSILVPGSPVHRDTDKIIKINEGVSVSVHKDKSSKVSLLKSPELMIQYQIHGCRHHLAEDKGYNTSVKILLF